MLDPEGQETSRDPGKAVGAAGMFPSSTPRLPLGMNFVGGLNSSWAVHCVRRRIVRGAGRRGRCAVNTEQGRRAVDLAARLIQ